VRNGLVALFALLVASTAAAAPPPHLVPIDRDFAIFASYTDMQAYKVAVRDALLGSSARHSWEAIVLPSFEREWGVHLEEREGAPEVVLTIMQEQLWGQMNQAAERPDGSIRAGDTASALKRVPRDTWTISAPLSRTTARLLDLTWSAMLSRAQEPADPPRCIDGTSYFAFQRDFRTGSRGGWGRCPQTGTPSAALLLILEDLRKAAGSSGQDLMRRDMAIAQKATVLIRSLD
jgi:hypothetical protein